LNTRLYPSAIDSILKGGTSNVISYANNYGGLVYNPISYQEQGILHAESLFVSYLGAASLGASSTTFEIFPGYFHKIPAGSGANVWINGATTGHKFSAYFLAPSIPFNPTPIPATFPPQGLTTQTEIIGSYLYQEYSDDDDLQNFVNAYNIIAQNYLDTVNGLNLPIYTAGNITGPLLDWVAQGIYGMKRPVLASGVGAILGPLGTYEFGTLELGADKVLGPTNITATTDDQFKRILTWALYRGDGRIFNVRWLKRRIMRFLLGANGSSPNIDETYQVSVTFGPNYTAAIRFIDYETEVTGGATFGAFELGTTEFGVINTEVIQLTPLPNRQLFYEAVLNSAIELPFQFAWTVVI